MRSATARLPQTANDNLSISAFPSRVRGGFKLLLLVLWVLLIYPPAWLAYRFKKNELRDRLRQTLSRGTLVILGIKLEVVGELDETRPLLLVTNHVSYLDIILLSSCTNARFTPKSEIEKWPFFGTLSKVANSVFIDRSAGKVGEMKERLTQALSMGKPLCLFPEATTGDGIRMHDFKPAFFSLAAEGVAVQPAALHYQRIGGLPIDSTQWPMLAWYGDMDLVPHVWQLMCMPGIRAQLTFLPVQKGSADRKELAQGCQQLISKHIEASRQQPAVVKVAAFNPSRLRKK